MRTVIGVFNSQHYAREAIDELTENGFSPEDVSVIMKDTTVDAGVTTDRDYGSGIVKGAGSGVATGAVLGGLAGLLVGIGAIALPGVGAFLVGGPLAVALGLTGAAATTVTGAATGAVAGGLIGALMGLGLSKEQAVAYEERIQDGALLMAVPVGEEYEGSVRGTLERFNAADITSVAVPSDRIRTRSTDRLVNSDREYAYDEEYPQEAIDNRPRRQLSGTLGGRARRATRTQRLRRPRRAI